MRRLILALAVLIVPAIAQAVPINVPYSGQLAENGELVNGSRNTTFNIWNAAVGGLKRMSQSEVINYVRGVGTTTLAIPDTLILGPEELWLEVEINGVPQTPRRKIGPVPYAVRASHVDNLPPAPGVGYYNHQLDAFINSQVPTVISSTYMECPADGYLFVSYNGALLPEQSQIDASFNIGLQGEPLTGAEITYTSHPPTGGVFEPNISLTKIIPVTAGPKSVFVYSWKRLPGSDNYAMSGKTISVIWFPAKYGPFSQ